MIRSRLLLAALALGVASRASGQSTPRLSASVLLGPSRTSGGEFLSSKALAAEIEAHWRIAVVRDVAIVTTAAFGGLSRTGDATLVCIPSSHGGCKPSGASLSGPSIRVGAERLLFAHLAVSASLGGGWYTSGNPDGASGRGFPFTVAVAVPVVSRMAIVAQGQRTEFRNFGGENFRSDALLFGIQVR